MAQQFDSTSPIYLQLADRIIRQILRQELQPGGKLPSVRDMAVQSGVNPNTVQRTYTELERMGVTETRRGQGTFVTENDAALSKMRETMKEERIMSFIRDMQELGFTSDEMLAGLEAIFMTEGGKES